MWTEFMQLVGTCRQLRKLSLSCLCGMSLEASFGFAIDLGFARHISDAVPNMGALKELRLPVSLFPDGRDSDACRAFVDRFASLKVEIR